MNILFKLLLFCIEILLLMCYCAMESQSDTKETAVHISVTAQKTNMSVVDINEHLWLEKFSHN